MRGLRRSVLSLISSAAVAAAPSLMLAQEAPVPPAPIPATTPASGPATQVATQPSTSPAIVSVRLPGSRPAANQITMNFKDAPIDAVLEHLSDVFRFEVIKEGPLDSRVTVLSTQPVSAEEAVALLNSVLQKSGYTAIQMGRILKVIPRDKAKKSNIPVHFGSDPTLIEPTDELVTQVIPVRSLDVVKLKADLQPLISPDADLTANAASNTLVVTDTQANIRRVVEIVFNMDKRDALENTIRVKQLKYADATAAAKLIMDIFKTDDQAAGQQGQQAPGPGSFFRAMIQGGGGGGGGGGRGGGGGGGGPAEDKGKTGKVVASADQRTNTIVVSGPADTLKVIEDVLDQLDSDPSAEQNFFLYPVKNGQAVDMAVTLNSLFGGSTGGSTNRTTSNTTSFGTGTTFGSSGGIGGSRTGSSGGGLGGGSLGGSSGSTGAISRSTPGATTGGGGGGGGLSALGGLGGGGAGGASSALSPVAALIGQVYCVADADTNSLLIACAAKFQDRVKAVIAQLDRPVAQVLIKVLIAEVTHDDSSDFGIDFSVVNQRLGGNGRSIITNLGNTAANTASGGLAVGLAESGLTATLHALAQVNKLDVLSRPYILASDNQPATITVGQEVPIITGSEISDLGTTTNTVTYEQIGITLNVTPHINPEGMVTLDIAPEVSQLTAQTVNVSPGVNAPVFDNRSADTRVGIKDGNTIVIGGLMQDQKTYTVSKVPLLGDLPWIGPAFARTQVDKTKTELLIFLTPHIAYSADRLKPMSDEEIGGLQLTPHAVERGVYDEHMKGMQLGGTATTLPSQILDPLLTGAPTTKPATAPSVPASQVPMTRPTAH